MHIFNYVLILSAIGVTTANAYPPAVANQNAGAYDLLKDKAARIDELNSMNGWAYIISGGAAVAISVPAYFLTEDVFARAIYSLGETLGVASIGYGSYLVSVQDDTTRFARILSQTALTPKQRDELSLRFLDENSNQARAVRKIRVITHSLTAGLNFLNGFTTSSRELRTALFFLGGINVLASVHYLFSESEDEKFMKRVASQKMDLIFVPSAVPLLAVRFHF